MAQPSLLTVLTGNLRRTGSDQLSLSSAAALVPGLALRAVEPSTRDGL
jgi:hypothetical protein